MPISMFDVVSIPDKGRGLVARVDIAIGTRILLEKPMFTLPAGLVPTAGTMTSELAVAEKLKDLPESERRQFLSLQNNFPGSAAQRLGGIFRTNSMPCGTMLQEHGRIPVVGVFFNFSLINHSCAPNTYACWNDDAKHETIHALQPISPGHEITIDYDLGHVCHSFSDRQERLSDWFAFQCECHVCSDRPGRQASDARRVRIMSLKDAIADADGRRLADQPEEILRDCHALLRILQDEFPGDTARQARVYFDAFHICINHGDQARASACARRGYQCRVVCEGEDSPGTKQMKALMERPMDHANFEKCSRDWSQRVDMVPKGLDTFQFDRWLFKLQN